MNKKFQRTIRVANIVEEGRLGGPQMRMALVTSELNRSKFKKKIDTTFIFPKNNSKEFRERCEKNGIKYFLFSLSSISRNWINIIKYLISFPFEVLMLSKFFKEHSFDIVHISSGSRSFKSIIAARISKTKVVWELNDTYAPIIIRCIFFCLSHLANNFIFGSDSTEKYYKRLNPKNRRNFLIQSPVDVDFFNPIFEYQNEEFIKKLVKEKKIIIGTVTNVSPVKGLLSFLRIAKSLSSYSNKVVFIVVGSVHNSQRNYYESLLDNINREGVKNFFFLGPRTDVRPLLKVMNIYVCSSNYESSPLSVWEAMSMKKAIISNDVGDVSKFITNNVSGFVVKKDDDATLIKHLKKLIHNSKLRNTLGKSARKQAKNKLDLKICATHHLKMYQEIFNHN